MPLFLPFRLLIRRPSILSMIWVFAMSSFAAFTPTVSKSLRLFSLRLSFPPSLVVTSSVRLFHVHFGLLLLNLVAQAQSGTGKTATFSIGVLNQIDVTVPDVQALILAPTRELASQIQKVVDTLGDHMGAKSYAAIGGTRVRDGTPLRRFRLLVSFFFCFFSMGMRRISFPI